MPPKKRKASESIEAEDSSPKRKLTKKELREQAIQRAKQSMQKDKERVEATKAKKLQPKQETSTTEHPRAKRRKVDTPEKKTVSKKQAREEAIQRAKEWGAQCRHPQRFLRCGFVFSCSPNAKAAFALETTIASRA